MKVNGDLVISGSIVAPKVGHVNNNTIPTYDVLDAGKLYFNNDTNSLILNNGLTHVQLLADETSNNIFRATLGNEWINADFTFNPSNLNALDNVSSLTSSSSLFEVITQLDSAISSQKISSLNDLSDVTVSTTPTISDILMYNGSAFLPVDINSIIGSIVFDITDANDTNISNPISGDTLVYSETTNTFNNVSKSYTYNTSASNTIFGIQHDLGSKFCHVTVIDKNTDTIINNTIVTFGDLNTLQISIPVATPIIAIITSP